MSSRKGAFLIVGVSVALLMLPALATAGTAPTGSGNFSAVVPRLGTEGAGPTPWSDNFDAYANGSQMHGQGGWVGWDNSPGAGALVTNAQSQSPPHSVDIRGASDLVHQYDGAVSGLWTYRANMFVPTAFTGDSYFILLNTYNHFGPYNWSVQIHANGPSNTMMRDDGGGSLPLIRGRWVELRTEVNLNNDTYNVFYDNVPLGVANRSWTNGLSGGGVLEIDAVDLFANGASSVYWDNLSLVPEPASLTLLGLGALVLVRRRR